MGKRSVCVRTCVLVFTTDVGVSRFYRTGIHLMADGKYQSQGWGWEGFTAGAEKVCLGLRPAVWRQRKQNPSGEKCCKARVDILSFSLRCVHQCEELKLEYVPAVVAFVVSSTSELHSSSTAGRVWRLGAGCTQVGTWLELGNSSTRLRGSSSSSLYVHANWERIPPTLGWNKQKGKRS